MRLYLNDASPYARLVRVLLLETELMDATQLVYVDPWQTDEDLLTTNPASKIPALVLSDGAALVESGCIADFLIRQSGRESLSPFSVPDGHLKLEILGLGRAATDCSFGAVIQQRFVPESPLIERWLGAVLRIAERLDRLYAARQAETGCDLSDLTVAVAFQYVDFRLGEIDWRKDNRHLADHVARTGQRASLASTMPK